MNTLSRGFALGSWPPRANGSDSVREVSPEPRKSSDMAPPPSRFARQQENSAEEFEKLKRLIHGKLVDKLDMNKLGELQGETTIVAHRI